MCMVTDNSILITIIITQYEILLNIMSFVVLSRPQKTWPIYRQVTSWNMYTVTMKLNEFVRFEYKVKARMPNKGYIISYMCNINIVFWTSQRTEPGQRDQTQFIFVLSFSDVCHFLKHICVAERQADRCG